MSTSPVASCTTSWCCLVEFGYTLSMVGTSLNCTFSACPGGHQISQPRCLLCRPCDRGMRKHAANAHLLRPVHALLGHLCSHSLELLQRIIAASLLLARQLRHTRNGAAQPPATCGHPLGSSDRTASCQLHSEGLYVLPVTMVRGCCNARNVYRHFLSMCNAGAAHAATTRGRTLLKVQPPLLTGWSLGYKQGCIVYRVVLKPTMYFTATGSLCQARISACRVSMHGSKLLQSNWKPSHGQHSVAIAIVPSVLTHAPVCDDPTSEPLTTAAVRR